MLRTTLEPGQWGLWLWLSLAEFRFVAAGTWNGNETLKWAVPQAVVYNDELGHGIDGNYYYTLVDNTFTTSTRATYNITGGQQGCRIRVLNRGNSGGIDVTDGSTTLATIAGDAFVDFVYRSSTWRRAGTGSI
jgi:hypothetical protein